MKALITVVAFAAGVVVATESIIAALQEPRTPGQQKLNDAFRKRVGL